ncbi:hypothetical protein BaRGS_00010825 [Batillaria attramentaria]|uniref:Peptidoglycan binding-like domain-containing protein n=1 Tax=Batillaria attramentaria TaxID=370345 RepID=A0ABD0LEG4_9CAEN
MTNREIRADRPHLRTARHFLYKTLSLTAVPTFTMQSTLPCRPLLTPTSSKLTAPPSTSPPKTTTCTEFHKRRCGLHTRLGRGVAVYSVWLMILTLFAMSMTVGGASPHPQGKKVAKAGSIDPNADVRAAFSLEISVILMEFDCLAFVNQRLGHVAGSLLAIFLWSTKHKVRFHAWVDRLTRGKRTRLCLYAELVFRRLDGVEALRLGDLASELLSLAAALQGWTDVSAVRCGKLLPDMNGARSRRRNKSWGTDVRDVVLLLREFLSHFGYLPNNHDTWGHVRQSWKNAVSLYQKANGLRITGRLNNQTWQYMQQPRCGNPDIGRERVPDVTSAVGHRSKRYANKKAQQLSTQEFRWLSNQVTWRPQKFFTKLSLYSQWRALKKAFDTWSEPSKLSLTYASVNPDIRVAFLSRDHGDGNGNAFDGRGKSLIFLSKLLSPFTTVFGMLSVLVYFKTSAHMDDDVLLRL